MERFRILKGRYDGTDFAGTNEYKVLNASNSYMHRDKSEMLKGTVIHPGWFGFY
ncbi:hypothetical protein KFK09_018121 [Dendrobium nobile]|uniref:Uncharacterized protein n=1 Tax=Dendrobium nobile TaxID=94219 RepID=A0A8T3ATY5_DENNO|nr:hypothetical protein KFK09_018121 [Dendrobium nobile]